ncbi:hypothetical protein ACFQY9_15890 [Microvirga aerilata]|uniref:hypothetical protein n=1 Tax=Microvirga aerilata TaxID=670292 RepID=UPI0036448F8B
MMSAVPDGSIDSDRILSLASKHHGSHQRPCTKRIAELEALTARLRAELQEAEAELQREKARVPLPGDFVRCPLTNFFGRVTKVTPVLADALGLKSSSTSVQACRAIRPWISSTAGS